MDRSAVKAYEAAELRAYAAMTGDAALTEQARAMETDTERSPVTAETREATVLADPVSAAGLGWLEYPALLDIVREKPEAYLDPDEAAAFWADESALRLVVLARVEGQPFEVVQAEYGSDTYALAARGDEGSVRRVWEMLEDQGLLDTPDPRGDGDDLP